MDDEAATGFTDLGHPPNVDKLLSGVPVMPQGIGRLVGSFMKKSDMDAFVPAALGNTLRPDAASWAAYSLAIDMPFDPPDKDWIRAATSRGIRIPRVVHPRWLMFHGSAAAISRYLQTYPDQQDEVVASCRLFGRLDVLEDFGMNAEQPSLECISLIDEPIIVDMYARIQDKPQARDLLLALMESYCAGTLQTISSKFDISAVVESTTITNMSYNWIAQVEEVINTMRWALSVGMSWGVMTFKTFWMKEDVLKFMHDNGYKFTESELMLAIEGRQVLLIELIVSFGVPMPRITDIQMRYPLIYMRHLREYPIMRAWIHALAEHNLDEIAIYRADIAYENRTLQWIRHSTLPRDF